MSKEIERIINEMHKAMEEQQFENEMEANAFMQEFIQKYNKNIMQGKSQKLDAYDYLEMAENAIDQEEAIQNAKKALKLDPFCLDAELIIAQNQAVDMEELKKKVEKIIQKGEKQLVQRNIRKEEDAGHFYGIFETRPYMRVRKEYLDLLIAQGRYGHAIREAEELIQLSENDNLGVRYLLMALYSCFEDEDKAINLIKKYPGDSALMLLPLIALYYKLEDTKKMKSYIRQLKKANPELQEALESLESPNAPENVAEIMLSPMYTPFSMEEIVLAYSSAMFLYAPMTGFLDMLYDEVVR